MPHDTLSDFITHARAAFGPLTSELIRSLEEQLQQLARAPSSEGWLSELLRQASPSRELYRDPRHGFVLLAHSEPSGLCRAPHDHGQSWVIYALARGEMEIGSFARIEEGGQTRLVKRDATQLRAGDARVYLPGDIHDTRCVTGPSLLFRFTARDLKLEEQAGRLTRYVARDGVWTVGPA